MLTYTVQEYNLISNAVLIASNYLDVAYDNLCAMHSEYFENIEEGGKHLRFMAECNPRGLESQIYGIIHALREAKYEIDLFIDPNSPLFQSRMADNEEKRAILEAYKKEQAILAAGGRPQ